MAIKTFAAIDVGSYELSMKIFELKGSDGMRQIDHIRYRLDLGTETYATGKLSYEKVDELCRILREFSTIMKAYKVDGYKAYGTSAIRETQNSLILLDQIRNRSGIKVDVLSNSEQRFLDYKSIASKGDIFNRIIKKGTAIVDIGGGSLQISLFDKERLITTQNIKLGVLRIGDAMHRLQPRRTQVDDLLQEMISNHLAVFKKLYLAEHKISNIIIVDDYVSAVLPKKVEGADTSGIVSAKQFFEFADELKTGTDSELSQSMGIPEENVGLLSISTALVKNLMQVMEADTLWAPGVTLSDGIAYEYAEKHNHLMIEHDFEKDILSCAKNISKRYMGSKGRGETLTDIALTIFDSMKKVHGLGKRERLLLQIATILHDCGKYISLVNVGECSYQIVMATEIIGLSHIEREMVAEIVKYNHVDFLYYSEIGKSVTLDKASYLIIAKLTAILRVANGLDRSHKQKFRNITAVLKEDELQLNVQEGIDITFEKGMFNSKADFFEEVYSVRPVIKTKKH